MTLRSLDYWRSHGEPYTLARPVAALERRLRGYGYTVYDYPDDRHLNATTPEDHTPFSATGWPIESPYGYGHALDHMPPGPALLAAGLPTLPQVARQIIADRNAGYAGISWLKYMNWTDEAGICRRESWKPSHETHSSTDKGHNHLSARSDCTTSAIGDDYDPVARYREAHGMSDFTADDRNKLANLYAGMFRGGPSCGTNAETEDGRTGNALFTKLDAIHEAVQGIGAAVAAALVADPAFVAALAEGVAARVDTVTGLTSQMVADALNGVTLSVKP